MEPFETLEKIGQAVGEFFGTVAEELEKLANKIEQVTGDEEDGNGTAE